MAVPIRLYQMNGCPYCMRVRDTLDELKLNYEVTTVYDGDDDADREMLIELSGQRFVPVVEYGDEVLTDSEKIMSLLREKH